MTTKPRSVLPWVIAAAAVFAGAIAIPAVDGGELSEGWWGVMAGLALLGVVLSALAVVVLARRGSGLAEAR